MGAQHHRFAEAAAELESPETVRVVYLTDAARQALNADRSDYTHGGLKRSYIPAKMPNWGADDTWHPELAKVFLDGETWVSNRNAKGQLEIYTPVFDSSGKVAAAVVQAASAGGPVDAIHHLTGDPSLFAPHLLGFMLCIVGAAALSRRNLVPRRLEAEKAREDELNARIRPTLYRTDDEEETPEGDTPAASAGAAPAAPQAAQPRRERRRPRPAPAPAHSQAGDDGGGGQSNGVEAILVLEHHQDKAVLIKLAGDLLVLETSSAVDGHAEKDADVALAVILESRKTDLFLEGRVDSVEVAGPLRRLNITLATTPKFKHVPPELAPLFNKRRTPRYTPPSDSRIPVTVRPHFMSLPLQGHVCDIGEGGMRVMIEGTEFQVGQSLHVAMRLMPGRGIHQRECIIRNRVDTSDGHVMFGLQFCKAPEEEHADLVEDIRAIADAAEAPEEQPQQASA